MASSSRRGRYIPKPLRKLRAMDSFTVLSRDYFRIANHLRAFEAVAAGMSDAARVFPAVIMYISAFEAYFQERLAIAHARFRDSGDTKLLETLESLKYQEGDYKEFKFWCRAIYKLFDREERGIDVNSALYRDLIAVRELRNAVAHYNPTFLAYNEWPASLEGAVSQSKVAVLNAGWVGNLAVVRVADWAHDTVRAAIEHFCQLSGAENPFRPREDGHTYFMWE